jgi:hypothetical protein
MSADEDRKLERIEELRGLFLACITDTDEMEVVVMTLLDVAVSVTRAAEEQTSGDDSIENACLLLIRDLSHMPQDEREAEQ